jgi:hypothetical protein
MTVAPHIEAGSGDDLVKLVDRRDHTDDYRDRLKAGQPLIEPIDNPSRMAC